MYNDSIDFANSKSDSYKATNENIMDELNSYFKAYIAGHSQGIDNRGSVNEELDAIFEHRAGFDDAMDSINRSRKQYSSSSSSSSSSDDDEMGNRFTNHLEEEDNDETPAANALNQLLDVEILDQHIDKANINGGSDATRAIENMAGGGIKPIDRDEHDTFHGNTTLESFSNSMLGMTGGKKPTINNTGTVRGYSRVTHEIRMKGNRVTERDRTGSNYLNEDGYVDMAMLGGSFDNEENIDGENKNGDEKDGNTHNDWNDENFDDHGKLGDKGEAVLGPGGELSSDDETEQMDKSHITQKLSDDLSDVEAYEYEEEEEPPKKYAANMASEIDHVLQQLRNKTARTLTGGTVNIRKKVVLTDMYPYILRT